MSQATESEPQQFARNLNELPREIRVVPAGVRILFGFLLSIAFTNRYAAVGPAVRVTHLVTMVFAATRSFGPRTRSRWRAWPAWRWR